MLKVGVVFYYKQSRKEVYSCNLNTFTAAKVSNQFLSVYLKYYLRMMPFKGISAEAKILYGLMLDRMSLSVKNRWFDDENRVYIIYTIEDIMEDLQCADQKAGKLLSELDTKKGIGLIERIRQGLGKPNIIYVKNFIIPSRIQNRENHDSGNAKITNQESLNSQVKNSDNKFQDS